MADFTFHLDSLSKTEEFVALFRNLRALKRENSGDVISSVEQSILYFLSFYERYKNEIDKRQVNRIMFSGLPDLCFEEHIENSTIVAEVLHCIHELPPIAMPHLVLFVSILSLTHKTLPMNTIISRNEMKKASFSALQYFLHHAYKLRLTFKDLRLTEMITWTNPLFYSKFLFFSDPKCVVSLLQFGLRFELSNKSSKRIHPIFLCAAEVLTLFVEVENLWNNSDIQFRSQQKNFSEKLCVFCQNFKLLVISTANPNRITTHVCETLMNYSGIKNIELLRPFLEYYFPDLNFELHQPPSLQYMCRYAIRSRLHEKWCLPYGVWKLSLPRPLVNYLNFTVDEQGNEVL